MNVLLIIPDTIWLTVAVLIGLLCSTIYYILWIIWYIISTLANITIFTVIKGLWSIITFIIYKTYILIPLLWILHAISYIISLLFNAIVYIFSLLFSLIALFFNYVIVSLFIYIITPIIYLLYYILFYGLVVLFATYHLNADVRDKIDHFLNNDFPLFCDEMKKEMKIFARHLESEFNDQFDRVCTYIPDEVMDYFKRNKVANNSQNIIINNHSVDDFKFNELKEYYSNSNIDSSYFHQIENEFYKFAKNTYKSQQSPIFINSPNDMKERIQNFVKRTSKTLSIDIEFKINTSFQSFNKYEFIQKIASMSNINSNNIEIKWCKTGSVNLKCNVAGSENARKVIDGLSTTHNRAKLAKENVFAVDMNIPSIKDHVMKKCLVLSICIRYYGFMATKERKGCDKDIENIKRTFGVDGHNYDIIENYLGNYMKKQNFMELIHKTKHILTTYNYKYDGFIFIFSGHGISSKDGYSSLLCLSDDTDVPVRDVIDHFGNSDYGLGDAFRGKPRLYFIQACRGEGRSNATINRRHKFGNHYGNSADDDILMIQSNVQGYASWRHSTKGSYLITSITKYLSPKNHRDDIIMTDNLIKLIKLDVRRELAKLNQIPISRTTSIKRLILSKDTNVKNDLEFQLYSEYNVTKINSQMIKISDNGSSTWKTSCLLKPKNISRNDYSKVRVDFTMEGNSGKIDFIIGFVKTINNFNGAKGLQHHDNWMKSKSIGIEISDAQGAYNIYQECNSIYPDCINGKTHTMVNDIMGQGNVFGLEIDLINYEYHIYCNGIKHGTKSYPKTWGRITLVVTLKASHGCGPLKIVNGKLYRR